MCKITGTDILLLHVAIMHLVSLTSIQILSLEVVFSHSFRNKPFYCILLIMEGMNQETLIQIIANFYHGKYSQREIIYGKAFLLRWHPQNPGLPCYWICKSTKSVNHKKGVGTPKNLTKPQKDVIKKKSGKQKLPPLQMQGNMIHSSELMSINEFFCLLILVVC